MAVYMRVAVDEFIAYTFYHIIQRKQVLLSAYLAVKNNVQQQVAQLFFYSLPILFAYGVGQLIGFFYGLVAQRLYGLLFVPGALLPQFIHYSPQPVYTLRVFHSVYFSCHLY